MTAVEWWRFVCGHFTCNERSYFLNLSFDALEGS